jgi:hypothetical protein
MRWLLCASVVVGLGGCDILFPELSGSAPDAAVVGDGGVEDGGSTSPQLAGVVCILADVRDYRSCATGSTGALRISVEETRQTTMTDVAGHFVLPLSTALTVATVGVADPANNFATIIMPVHLSAGGVANNVALPVLPLQTLSTIELDNGLVDDAQRGILIAWAVDATGAPVAGVSTNLTGVLFDNDSAANTLSPNVSTRSRGALALFAVTPTSLTLTLTPPPTVALSADTFTVPIRPGAVTATTLVLPPN